MEVATGGLSQESPSERSAPGQVRGLVGHAEGLLTVSGRLLLFNLGYLALAWAVAIGSIALFWAIPNVLTFAFAFIVVSSRQQALLNCEHECVHGKFVRGRRANDLVGTWLCGAPVGSPYGAAKARHLAHHRLLGRPEDPDRELHSEDPPKDHRRGLVSYFLHGLLGGYALMILFGTKEDAPGSSGGSAWDLLAVALVQVAIGVALTLALAWWVYPALWLAPLASVTALSHLIRNFAEHAITEGEQRTNANRLITIRSNLIERGVIAPYWMNLHAEHHLLPSVPAPRLPELRRRLADAEQLPPLLERRSYAAAVRHYFGSLRD
jgi:fatty acid desaturase